MKTYYLKRLKKRFAWRFNPGKNRYMIYDKTLGNAITLDENFYNTFIKSADPTDTLERTIRRFHSLNDTQVYTIDMENQYFFEVMKGYLMYKLDRNRFYGMAIFQKKQWFNRGVKTAKSNPMGKNLKSKSREIKEIVIEKIKIIDENNR